MVPRSEATHRHGEFRTRSLVILALCRLCEPIAFTSLFPYSHELVRHFHTTRNDTQVATYVGVMIMAFALAECLTAVLWGRLSDKIGRKPVLLAGLLGTAVSMLGVGFSSSLRGIVVSRAIGGALNGNVGVIQTMVAEMVPLEVDRPFAYSMMPFVWTLGSVVGPVIGGALAMPCELYPALFSRGGLWDSFPFLLPNLVCVSILVGGVMMGALFLEETHPTRKHKSDHGREAGARLLSWYRRRSTVSSEPSQHCRAPATEADHLESDPSNACLIKSSHYGSLSKNTSVNVLDGSTAPSASASVLDRDMIAIIANHGITAFHSIAFDVLMPVMLSERPSKQPLRLPAHLTGGLGLSATRIGSLMACQGLFSLIAQLWVCPLVMHHFGVLHTLRYTSVLWSLLYLVVPYALLLPPHAQLVGIYSLMLAKSMFQAIVLPSNAILLARTADCPRTRGAVNGVAASVACLCRAIAPPIVGIIHAAGLRIHCAGLAWWFGGLVCTAGAMEIYYRCSPRVESVEHC